MRFDLFLFAVVGLISSILIQENAGTVHRKQTFAITAFVDWSITSSREPPIKELVDVDETTGGTTKTISFKAFEKSWRITAQLNNILLSDSFSFDERDTNGRVVSTRRADEFRNCFYIGTVDAGANEQGLAAVTSCAGKFRVYLVTNINDYMINPQIPRGHPSHDTFSEHSAYAMDIINGTENGAREYALRPTLIKFTPQRPMTEGRAVFTEKTLIFDESYVREYRRRMDDDRGMRLYAIELIHFAQLWFVHHTLGMQNWYVLKKVIFLTHSMPFDNPTWKMQSICKWQHNTFSDAKEWDQVGLITSDPQHCNGIGGIANAAGTCNKEGGNCYCVTDHKFHPMNFVRTLAHESAHTYGMPDDYNTPHNTMCFTGMMFYAAYGDKDWSTCAIQRMENYLYSTPTDCVYKSETRGLPRNFQPPVLPLNVAWRATAVQSSTYEYEEKWGAWKATDGPIAGIHKKDPNPKYASCTHTQKETNPWLRIELDQEARYVDIDSIDIFNREDCCASRLTNFEVRVGDYTNVQSNALCYHHKGTVPGGEYGMVHIRCDRRLRGRYVSVQILGAQKILSVCQVNVNQLRTAKPFKRIGTCVNQNSNCGDWIGGGECAPGHGRRETMEKECPKTCDFCQLPGAPHMDKSWKSHAYPSTEKPSCKDSRDDCAHLAVNGRCDQFASSCPRQCDKSCEGIAPDKEDDDSNKKPDESDPNCKDTDPGCAGWKMYCNDGGYVEQHCKRTCQRC